MCLCLYLCVCVCTCTCTHAQDCFTVVLQLTKAGNTPLPTIMVILTFPGLSSVILQLAEGLSHRQLPRDVVRSAETLILRSKISQHTEIT